MLPSLCGLHHFKIKKKRKTVLNKLFSTFFKKLCMRLKGVPRENLPITTKYNILSVRFVKLSNTTKTTWSTFANIFEVYLKNCVLKISFLK